MAENIDWRDSFPRFLRTPWPWRILSLIVLLASIYVYLEDNMVIGCTLFATAAMIMIASIRNRWWKFAVGLISIGILVLLCFRADNLSQPFL